MPKYLQIDCVPSSVREKDRFTYGIDQALKNKKASAFVVNLAVVLVLASFVYLSIAITTCWLLFVVLINEPNISIAINCNSFFLQGVSGSVCA